MLTPLFLLAWFKWWQWNYNNHLACFFRNKNLKDLLQKNIIFLKEKRVMKHSSGKNNLLEINLFLYFRNTELGYLGDHWILLKPLQALTFTFFGAKYGLVLLLTNIDLAVSDHPSQLKNNAGCYVPVGSLAKTHVTVYVLSLQTAGPHRFQLRSELYEPWVKDILEFLGGRVGATQSGLQEKLEF